MTAPVKSHVEIEGMHCDGCVRRVTAALKRIPGVEVSAVQVGSADILVREAVPPRALADAIHKVGFTLKTTTP
jgi:copper chaperone